MGRIRANYQRSEGNENPARRRRWRPAVMPLERRELLSTIVVNNPTDAPVVNQTDLRQAIAQANSDGGGDTIVFSSLFDTPQTITLTEGPLILTGASTTTITGPAANTLNVSGGGKSRVFDINGASAVISGLTISGGMANTFGGGLYNQGGKVTLTDCLVTQNTANEDGGGLANTAGATLTLNHCTVAQNSLPMGAEAAGLGGGLWNAGTATLTDCGIALNQGTNGGGLYNDRNGVLSLTSVKVSGNTATDGAGLYNRAGKTTLTDCTVSNNQAGPYGGGLYNTFGGTLSLTGCMVSNNTTIGLAVTIGGSGGGGLFSLGTTTLTVCTVSGNSGDENGGGLFVLAGTTTLTDCTVSDNSSTFRGGGLRSGPNSTLTLTGCTVSDNFTGGSNPLVAGGGGGGLFCEGTATLIDCTVSGNTTDSGFGGGLYSQVQETLTLTNCTLSGNDAPQGGGLYVYSRFGGTTTLSNTIVAGSANGGDILGPLDPASAHNLIGGNPLLAPLGNYGGSTLTMPLLPGSPAIGKGTTAGAPATDQRGLPRVGPVDIGAFQSQGFTLAPVAGSAPLSASAGTPFAKPLAVTVTANNPLEPVDGGFINFAAPATGASATLSAATALIADGQASVTATANATPGAYRVTASAPGTSVVGLTLTNTAAPSLRLTTPRDVVDQFDGLTSLRQAIAYANSHPGPDTITYDPAVFGKAPRTIKLIGGPLVLTDPATVTIIGPGANRLTLSGGRKSRVFDIRGGSLALEGLTIAGGRAVRGGGILNDGGMLALDRVVLRGNHARVGGGLFNDGKAALTHVVIRGNSARVGSGLFNARNATLTRGRSPVGGRR